MSKKETLEKNKVYMVPADGGTITTCYRQACLDDCVGDIFTAEAIEAAFENGEAVFSDDFYYATNREALAKFDKSEAVDPMTKAVGEDGTLDGAPPEYQIEPETETLPDPPAETAPEEPAKEITVGEVMVHTKKAHIGEVIERDGALVVTYTTKKKKFEEVVSVDANLDK